MTQFIINKNDLQTCINILNSVEAKALEVRKINTVIDFFVKLKPLENKKEESLEEINNENKKENI